MPVTSPIPVAQNITIVKKERISLYILAKSAMHMIGNCNFHDANDLPLFTSASFRPVKNYTRSQDLKKFLEFHHQGPVTFLKVVSEPVLARVYRLSRDLEGNVFTGLENERFLALLICCPPY